jgi:hypothetical protein
VDQSFAKKSKIKKINKELEGTNLIKKDGKNCLEKRFFGTLTSERSSIQQYE